MEKKTSKSQLDDQIRRLIQQQGVAPVTNLDELADLWPGDDDPDRLMRYVLEERAARLSKNKA